MCVFVCFLSPPQRILRVNFEAHFDVNYSVRGDERERGSGGKAPKIFFEVCANYTVFLR